MAALLESVLLRKVDVDKVVDWLKSVQEGEKLSSIEPQLAIQKQEFVPFLLNFLREQSGDALTNGPATPAKIPSGPRAPAKTQGFSDNPSCRSAGSALGSRSASRVQLFSASPGNEPDAAGQSGLSGVSAFGSPPWSTGWSPASRPSGSERKHAQKVCLGDYMVSPPELQSSTGSQSHKGRKKSAGSTPVGGQARHGGGRGGPQSGEAGGRRSARGGGHGRTSEQVSPSTPAHLNFSNLEDFPPVGASPVSSGTSKPSRRINPTPVSADRPHSKPKTCFMSTPLQKASSPPLGVEPLEGLTAVGSPMSLKEERELLKREKTKLAQQAASLPPSSLDPCTPTKSGTEAESKVTSDPHTTCPEPSKVTFSSDLDVLAELYCTCISENLVPNLFLELFFVMQLLTSRSLHTHTDEEQLSLCSVNSDVLERCYLRQVHNCVYFAVKVLENQFQLVAHLDKCTLRLLAENERVASFSPDLKDRLSQAQNRSTAKLSPSVSTFIHSVPFQPATDNRSNFGSDKAFHTFKKQRDIFYEVLREWEDLHKEPGWNFDAALGAKIRGMMSQLTSAGNHSHFARLFLKQLIQMCKGPRTSTLSVDTADADLLGMLGADSLGRLKRLEERLIQPHRVVGPCPPPTFPGHQEFFRDFIQSASCCQMNQHLQDSLCQQLLHLDEVSILRPSASVGEGEEEEDGDMEQQDEKQRFSSVLLLARLLAKFLGFISFLPYQTSERPSREIQEASVALRSKSVQVLDVCAVLSNSVRRRRTILTVPWLVEFLSMMDFIGPLLLCYRVALGTLLLLYRRLQLNRHEEMCYLNKLLLVSVLGWLFQIPVIPEDIFFTSEFTALVKDEGSATGSAGLDCIPLVDQQLLYTCCPFLGEFRKLLAAFVSGSAARSGGIIRKITPTSAELKGTPTANRSQQKLQVDLEQAFFHNQPPSLHRTVEFVAERVGSNAVKHIKATLVQELIERGEKMLRDGLQSSNANSSKLNDSICAQLCDVGWEALEKATRFCNEKSPDAIRILLPVETTPPVLTTSENITKRLAAEKACSWLSTNITALIRREWKSRYDRVKKALGSPAAPDSVDPDIAVVELVRQDQMNTPRKKQERATSCPPLCKHNASLPSDVLIEIKELLSIAVGPRADEELPTGPQLKTLLQRVGNTLECRKFLTALSEQMLQNSTVLLACKLVSGELPVCSLSRSGGAAVDPGAGPEPSVSDVLEQLAELWERSCCSSAPLHQLFTPLTVAAVLKASDTEKKNYLFLVRKLVDKRILNEDEVESYWRKLTDLTLPALIENFQLQSQRIKLSLPLAEMQSCLDMLQVSHQTIEGAT
ncbi:codanin-1 isoform X2 [Poeciliopsis prolifica]|uniref:codanin-1 isoform X2 n=1 Tax=Poeciliopsis prolifica TaxID=188132 RepID=UPI002413A290|nr:codanin-1 isoform X2 [Poeciliopsis prolifica]